MKIAIVYSSVTGNTKMVAEAVYKEVTQHHDCDVVYLELFLILFLKQISIFWVLGRIKAMLLPVWVLS